jgi:hypothetical protein
MRLHNKPHFPSISGLATNGDSTNGDSTNGDSTTDNDD